jgi:hypothetical protein
MGPAQTSGGCAKDARITAEVLPSRANDKLTSPAPAVMTSSPVQSVVILESAGSTVATPLMPSTFSPNRI